MKIETEILTILNKNRYFRNFKRDEKLIFSALLIIFSWAIIYLLLFYKPSYKSTAKVWIKDLATSEYVTALDKENQMAPLTMAGNPLLTQIEILKSEQLKQAVSEYKLKQGEKVSPKSIIVNVKNDVNTDILTINYKDRTPLKAQQTLNQILKDYEDINLSINKKVKTARREYIDSKLEEITQKLYAVRNDIRNYKRKNLSIDLAEQSKGLVDQELLMSAKLADTNAAIRNKKSSISEFRRQLSLNSKDAINAVALGGNPVLTQLRNDLNTAIQEYEFDSAKLAETNPKMVAQKAKIAAINKQIKKQIELSVGKYAQSQKINIFDPVREDLVRNYATAQTDLMGLEAESQSINSSIAKINQQKAKLPEDKFNLDNLDQEETVLSEAYNQLKEKQIEAKIKEAEAVSNVIIVDAPSLPQNASFPTVFQTLILAILLGGFAGIFVSILKTLLEDVCDDIETIEKVTGTSALGIIPWIKDLQTDDKAQIDQAEIINSLAYDNIVSNLMIKCYKDDKKVITFTSSSLNKTHPTRIHQLAARLRKSGHSVILLDCDFRTPTIFKTADVENKVKVNLSELIVELEQKIHQNNSQDEDVQINTKQQELLLNREIRNAILKDDRGINYLGNKDIIFESCEFFGTAAFGYIINFLKKKYDWVLIDTGVAHITPEVLIISKLSDGVVLLVNKSITFSTLTTISKSLKNAGIPIIGTILRESDSQISNEYKKYLEFQQEKINADDKQSS